MNEAIKYTSPSEAGLTKINELRELTDVIYTAMLTLPEGRERSLALTNLEQALMWGNKAASRI